MREGRILDLVDRVHAAPLEKGGWARAVDALREAFEAAWGHVLLLDPATAVAPFRVLRGPDPAWAEIYLRDWTDDDPWAEPTLRQPVGTVGASEQILAPEVLHRTRFYAEWLRPQGLEGGMGAVLERTPEGRTAVMAFLRAPGRAPYGETELAALQSLVPHVRRALRVEERLRLAAIRQGVSEGILEHLGGAAFLVEVDGRLVWSNRRGSELLAQGDVLGLEGGHIVAVDQEARPALRDAIARATAASGRRGSLLRLGAEGSGGRRGMSVWPVPTSRGAGGGRFAFLLCRPLEAQRRIAPEVLRAFFGLTSAEAEVAVALTRGEDVRGIARARGVSGETVRGQVKAVLAKTGCTRQAELVQLLLSGPAGWPDPRR